MAATGLWDDPGILWDDPAVLWDTGLIVTRTPIPVAAPGRGGAEHSQWAAADVEGGNSVPNTDGRTILLLSNLGTLPRTCDIQVPVLVDGELAVQSRSVTVPAGQTVIAGPYRVGVYSGTLLLDPEHPDLRISAVRMAGAVAVAAPAGPFGASGLATVGNLAASGLTTDGSVLVVDATVTGSTIDGDVLAVTV